MTTKLIQELILNCINKKGRFDGKIEIDFSMYNGGEIYIGVKLDDRSNLSHRSYDNIKDKYTPNQLRGVIDKVKSL